MNGKLLFQAIVKYLCGVLMVGVLIFLPAGTTAYSNGWVFMAVLFLPMFLAGLVMLWKAPELLKSRLEGREKEMEQKKVIALSALMFLGGFIAAGLDFRLNGPSFPYWVSVSGVVLFLLSYAMYAEVMRENAYLSRTIRVKEGQKVVDTGLYGIVRHPMYMTTIFLFLSIPLILGSVWSLLFFLIHPFLMAKRIRNEEQVLCRELEGYEDYRKKVRYRMIPFIW